MLILEIHNDGTGTESSANYDYRVRVNEQVIEQGHITGHDRREGWAALVNLMLQERMKCRTASAGRTPSIGRRARKTSGRANSGNTQRIGSCVTRKAR